MKNKFKKTKTIVVTGVSSGIGKAIVEQLLINNGDYFVIGMGRKDIGFVNPNYRYVHLDLSDQTSITSAIKSLAQIKIDIFISNAGVGYRGTVEDLKINYIRKQFEVNYLGPITLIKELLPQIKRPGGKIINIAALGSLITVPTFGYYTVSKLALSKTLEVLQEESNLKIFNVYLGAVKSNFGKNIVETINLEESNYKDLYSEWQTRFESFFKGRSKPEEVAKLIESIINDRSSVKFVKYRDRIIAMSKILFPNSLHKKIVNYYYKI